MIYKLKELDNSILDETVNHREKRIELRVQLAIAERLEKIMILLEKQICNTQTRTR